MPNEILVTNHYSHKECGEEWSLEGCDSFHNDECPACESEILPTSSTVFTESGESIVNH
jgi:hypothetical protein